MAKGEAPLGFINPWIYSSGYKALRDIVDNTTYGGQRREPEASHLDRSAYIESGCHTKTGFPVPKGWDAGKTSERSPLNSAVVANDPCESDRIWQPELRGIERCGVCKVS